ncbi:hypothetical protein B591_22411 [Streptomyces sp. GBA 94-10 4N24]|uniref:hypothetical protein n=1 Tax=Streptomyces TaxID=1883 RepID=UPI0003C31647|nr:MULTISPECIES: hypothetical protein [unclassified Streptomyces]ESP97091.1 hypothetical protein B591_22411 [Streptomyces sp. GBA 94-10 4N24]ESQ03257.1 hypothetical protein B590_22247 [Streptomyces sp. PVA_94-07]UZN61508.1 hypothetical protein B591N_22411 [Streptomyces sp. GBA 94-10 4N24]
MRAGSAFRLVHAEAFAGPPYFETDEAVSAAFRRFPRQAGSPGFRAAPARTEDGEPVGMAYGHRLPRGAAWWRELTGPVPEAMSREDGRRAFGLMEPSAAYRSWGYRKAEGRPGSGGRGGCVT